MNNEINMSGTTYLSHDLRTMMSDFFMTTDQQHIVLGLSVFLSFCLPNLTFPLTCFIQDTEFTFCYAYSLGQATLESIK